MRGFWLIALLGLQTWAKTAEPVLYTGLPTELDADFLREAGFIAFKEIPELEARERRKPRHYASAPLGGRIVFDNRAVNPLDREALHEVFAEAMYAYVPAGAKIRVTRSTDGSESWDYPVGMSVAHVIRIKNPESTVFELRLVMKLEADRWAFGSYAPSNGGRLRLNTYEGWPEFGFRAPIRHANGDVMMDVSLKRVKLSSCQVCHFTNSLSEHQYAVQDDDGGLDFKASVARTGPCGFVPANEYIRQWWETQYKRAHGGVSPFEETGSKASAAR